jgi:hypothetical protein
MDNPRRYWFGPKRIGWGYSPRTWEGWLATLAYIVSMVTVPRYAARQFGHEALAVSFVLLTLVFLGVAIWKSER